MCTPMTSDAAAASPACCAAIVISAFASAAITGVAPNTAAAIAIAAVPSPVMYRVIVSSSHQLRFSVELQSSFYNTRALIGRKGFCGGHKMFLWAAQGPAIATREDEAVIGDRERDHDEIRDKAPAPGFVVTPAGDRYKTQRNEADDRKYRKQRHAKHRVTACAVPASPKRGEANRGIVEDVSSAGENEE